MYFETQVGKLSKVQLNNLLKGKNVRIKKGTAHTINLTEGQLKKFHRNSRQGKALTIKLTQDQIAKQGGGILGDLIGLVHPTAGKVASMVGLGMKKNGKGFLENMAKEAAINMAKAAGKFAIDKGADFAKGKIEGMGIRKKRRATPAQLEALARGRAIRDANRSGGALFAAGY